MNLNVLRSLTISRDNISNPANEEQILYMTISRVNIGNPVNGEQILYMLNVFIRHFYQMQQIALKTGGRIQEHRTILLDGCQSSRVNIGNLKV